MSKKEKKLRGLIKILELNKKKGFNESKINDTIHQIELQIIRLNTRGV